MRVMSKDVIETAKRLKEIEAAFSPRPSHRGKLWHPAGSVAVSGLIALVHDLAAKGKDVLSLIDAWECGEGMPLNGGCTCDWHTKVIALRTLVAAVEGKG